MSLLRGTVTRAFHFVNKNVQNEMGQEKVNARSLLDRGSVLSFTLLALQRSPMPNTYLGGRTGFFVNQQRTSQELEP